MLTAEHADARKQGAELVLRRLDARALREASDLAEALLEAARAHVGRTREELYEAWKSIAAGARMRKLAAGLEKLVDDACVFESDDSLDPVALRRTLFLRAAEARRTRDQARPFDRAAVVQEIATALGKTPAQLDVALFSDLRGEHVLQAAPTMNAASLVEAYELGRAQAVLLRAVKVTCEIRSASPLALRAFFARMKFHRLLFTVARLGSEGRAASGEPHDGAFTLTIDGPFSMFESVTKYGLRLALVLPALRTLDRWSLAAEVRWGAEREPLLFRMASSDAGERPPAEDDGQRVSDEVLALESGLAAAAAAGSPWTAEVATTLLEHAGHGVCIPDLVLRHRDGGEPVYVEVLGFWSRDAVWRRIELAQSGLGARVVFCASARLRVSAEVLGDDTPAALYVYKGKPSARALLSCVERVGAAARTRA